MQLSIIIPYYNVKEYTDELLDVLDPQVRDSHDIECVVVDDGSRIPFETSYKWCRVMHKDNGGAASARNMGLDNTTGEYVQFIDADDMVPKYFIERLLTCIKDEQPDVVEYSWKSLNREGSQHDIRLRSINDRLHNPSVCTRCFKRAFLGENRFNEKKDCTEDEDFSRKVGYLRADTVMKRAIIPEYMYYYRTAVSNSKFKRFKKGIQKTKRIVYHYEHVTSDMMWLYDEIKKEDEVNEVWLVTKKCDIPGMERYARVSYERALWGHELRGEKYPGFQLIKPPENYDIIFYCEYSHGISGILTFLYNTCQNLKAFYNIMVLYDDFDADHIRKLQKVVPVEKVNAAESISCNLLVLNRLSDKVPLNVKYKKVAQMCHACKIEGKSIPVGRDYTIIVSESAKKTWGAEAEFAKVINNMAYPEPEKVLMLISATRTHATDKGQADNRMKKLAEMLNKEKIPFLWLVFSDKGLDNPPPNVVNMRPNENIQGFIQKCDYLVQLSDQEAYSMSILEALALNVPVICTDFESAYEEGVRDGENGYIIPKNMDFNAKKLLKIPKFEYIFDRDSIIDSWKQLVEAPESAAGQCNEVELQVMVNKYYDMELKRELFRGYRYTVDKDRAKVLIEKGIARRI